MLCYVRNSHFVSKQNNLMTTISTQALYNPYFNLQTTSQFPKHFHSLGYTCVVLCCVVFMLELLTLSRIEVKRSVFWSAESEALHSAEHYGPLKTRLYHNAALWSAESEAKNHGKISKFPTFLLYLDYELLLRSLRSLRSN